jgi:hypothetical protein
VEKRAQRRLAVGIHRQVPGPEHVEREPAAADLEHALDRRRRRFLDRVVKPLAVGGGVVEAELGGENVVPEIGEPGVPRRALPQLVHPVEEAGELGPVLAVGTGGGPERPLPDGAVGTLEEGLKLGQRALLAVPFHRHRAGDPLVPRAQLLQLGKDGDVGFPEDLDRGAETGQGGFQRRCAIAGLHQSPRQLDAPLLHPGQDLGGEAKVIGLLLGIGGVDGIGDHGDGRRLGDQLFQRGPALEPALDGALVERPLGEVVEIGSDVLPTGLGESAGGGGKVQHGQTELLMTGQEI